MPYKGIGIIIDDNADVATDCAEQGIITIVMKRPWNKNLPENPKIIKVPDWQGIVNALLPRRYILPYPKYGAYI